MMPLTSIIARLKKILSNKKIKEIVEQDLINIFKVIGFSIEISKHNTDRLICDLEDSIDIEIFEDKYKGFLYSQKIEGELIPGIVKNLSLGRAERIYSEIIEFIPHGKDRVLDFGCGNGLVIKLLKEKDNIDASGCDIENYVDREAKVPFIKINKYKIECADASFTACYANSVLHHDPFPEKIIEEISRVVTERFILIEDVLVGDSEIEQNVHRERLFFIDYVYNRLVVGEQVHMPGTYKTAEEWQKIITAFGWTLIKSSPLGQSQILPAVFRERMIFSR